MVTCDLLSSFDFISIVKLKKDNLQKFDAVSKKARVRIPVVEKLYLMFTLSRLKYLNSTWFGTETKRKQCTGRFVNSRSGSLK